MAMEMVCILCPMGCGLTVERGADGAVMVAGNGCARGVKYGEQELLSPMRVVTASVRVSGGEMPLCPVKTAGMVPKGKIGEVLAVVRSARAQAPVRIGDVIVPNAAGTGINVVATANR